MLLLLLNFCSDPTFHNHLNYGMNQLSTIKMFFCTLTIVPFFILAHPTFYNEDGVVHKEPCAIL